MRPPTHGDCTTDRHWDNQALHCGAQQGLSLNRRSGRGALLGLGLVQRLLRQAAHVEQRDERDAHAQRHLPALDAAQAGLVVVDQRAPVAACARVRAPLARFPSAPHCAACDESKAPRPARPRRAGPAAGHSRAGAAACAHLDSHLE